MYSLIAMQPRTNRKNHTNELKKIRTKNNNNKLFKKSYSLVSSSIVVKRHNIG